MQLIAQKNFTLVRQIDDHTDTGTYYIQAVIRNAYTDVILETLDLTSKGSLRFKKDWKVPAVSSGESYYISIVSSVYTDAGYTTKSNSYGDEENTYQVIPKEIFDAAGGGGSLGASRPQGNGSLSRRDIRDIISEELVVVLEKINNKEILDNLTSLKKVISESKTDTKPLSEALSAIKSMVSSIEIPKLDIEPIIKKLDGMEQSIASDKNDSKTEFNDTKDRFKESVAIIVQSVEKKINKAISTIKVIPKGLSIDSFVINSVGIKELEDEEENKRKEEEEQVKKEEADKDENININNLSL